jgi:hypothetical protein
MGMILLNTVFGWISIRGNDVWLYCAATAAVAGTRLATRSSTLTSQSSHGPAPRQAVM